MLALNKVYNQDCIDGMNQIDDHSVDMIFCDPPYQLTDNKWDSLISIDKLWCSFNRIIKENGPILFTAIQPFANQIISSNIHNFKYEWIWEKEKGTGFMNAHKQPLRAHEQVLVFYKKQPVYNPQMTKGDPYYKRNKNITMTNNYLCDENKKVSSSYNNGARFPLSILKFPRESTTSSTNYHPTQKPVKLLEYLIKTYTNEGQVVLDPTMGSGTTAVACQNINRQYIGFETDVNYYNIIQNRLHANCMKLDSFEENKLSIEG